MADAKASEQRRGGLRAIGATLPEATRNTLGRRGYVEARLMLDWRAIVGDALGRFSMPEKLARSRSGQGGYLQVLVDPAFALELQHLAPLVIERVNGYFGYAAVAQLKLRQGRLPMALTKRRPKPAPLAPETQAELTSRLSGIGDPELRAALDRLGQSVLSTKRHRP